MLVLECPMNVAPGVGNHQENRYPIIEKLVTIEMGRR